MTRMFLFAALVLGVDQATKAWVRSVFVPGDSVPVIADVFHLTYVRNTGAAFGILQGNVGLLIAASAVMVAAVLLYSRAVAGSQPLVRVGYGLALGGALGNLVDRVRFGWVTDFFDFRIWPVFNIADAAIFTGVCILLWRMAIASPKPLKGGEEGA